MNYLYGSVYCLFLQLPLARPNNTSAGRFWKDVAVTMEAIITLDQASSNDGDGSDARSESTESAQKAFRERVSRYIA